MPSWSPFGVQTRRGWVRGIHGDHVVVEEFHAKPLLLSRVVSMVGMGTMFVVVSRLRRQHSMFYICGYHHTSPDWILPSVSIGRCGLGYKRSRVQIPAARPNLPLFTAFNVLVNAGLESNRSPNSHGVEPNMASAFRLEVLNNNPSVSMLAGLYRLGRSLRLLECACLEACRIEAARRAFYRISSR